MGTIFAPTSVSLTMGYYEIKVYSIMRQSSASASKHFQNSWFRYLDEDFFRCCDKQKWYKNLDGYL